MVTTSVRGAAVAALLLIPVLVATQSAPGDAVSPRAKQLHDAAIVVDSHDDTTQRLMFDTACDIGKRNASNQGTKRVGAGTSADISHRTAARLRGLTQFPSCSPSTRPQVLNANGIAAQ